jgi:hypothetical protein
LNAALSHNPLLNLSSDDHTQYALLAGRSGGQVLKGGTGAAEGLTLQATSGAGAGSEFIRFLVGNNGNDKIGEFGFKPAAITTHVLRLRSIASTNVDLLLADDTTDMWSLRKAAANAFALIDWTASQASIIVRPNSALSGAHIELGPASISTSNVNIPAVRQGTTFTGSGDGPQGFAIGPGFSPSANINIAYGYLATPFFNPSTGVTITSGVGFFSRWDSGSGGGNVTTAYAGLISSPAYGTIKPGTIYGLNIANQGAAGVTNAIGLFIDAQSGATNNYDMGFSRVDLTAAGTYYGRVPVLYNGLLKYIHVFNP